MAKDGLLTAFLAFLKAYKSKKVSYRLKKKSRPKIVYVSDWKESLKHKRQPFRTIGTQG